ncbi:dynein-related subfamily AAA family protein [Marinobacter nauticus]|uniref:Dynein-related subfamily AAA family protein n=1 Tax=Marinobacter nauticus TaxID=2743 RepID=A0A368Y858_MARNT|nr:AAA family ATPase [Marinobacter nauticus]RCW75017.1 dynein-related subfamily AAA family protein [Marinobacter nauticus]
MSFHEFCRKSSFVDGQQVIGEPGYAIKYANAKGEIFIVNAQDLADFLIFLEKNYDEVKAAWSSVPSRKSVIYEYEEKSYRAIYGVASRDDHLKSISSTGRSQTRPLTSVISKFICYLGGFEYQNVSENSHFDYDSIVRAVRNLPSNIKNLDHADPTKNSNKTKRQVNNHGFVRLPKSFFLLAGVSGSGKTRFVRQQAELTGSLDETYCLVPVRPDWHEPSDLLGYISRLGADGPRYVVSDVLRFIVSAWKEIVAHVETGDGRPEWVGRDLAEIRPFWLCLDEMNLAPVEQYFADFLSVLETRRFLNEEELQQYNADNGVERSYVYSSDSVLKPAIFTQLDSVGESVLRNDLGLVGGEFDGMWDYFRASGIPLPFNLIVAGTVNMDETTHGFSRKVIDRALSIDFGEFFPNEFDQFFDQQTEPVALSYPLVSSANKEDLKDVPADPEGKKTVAFLSGINSLLKGSPFELAYRALNELLLSVACLGPQDDRTLQAVWDDFLMMKVLPRIEGDQEKLAVFDGAGVDAVEPQDILGKLSGHLKTAMAGIWESDRPDLLRVSIVEGETLNVECRSKAKLNWMRHRLQTNGFTSFWP